MSPRKSDAATPLPWRHGAALMDITGKTRSNSSNRIARVHVTTQHPAVEAEAAANAALIVRRVNAGPAVDRLVEIAAAVDFAIEYSLRHELKANPKAWKILQKDIRSALSALREAE